MLQGTFHTIIGKANNQSASVHKSGKNDLLILHKRYALLELEDRHVNGVFKILRCL
jgi:hypothetical protein